MKDTNQQEDKLARRIMQSAPLETPSKDFAANILRQLQTEPTIPKLVFKPLIPTSVLTTVIGSMILIIIIAYFKFNLNSGWFENNLADKINFSIFDNVIPIIVSSNILLYAVILFLIVFLFQVNLLKNYHTRSFTRLGS